MPVIKCCLFILLVFFLHSCDARRLGSASLSIWKKIPDKGTEMLKLSMNVNFPSVWDNGDSVITSSKLEDLDAHFMKNDALNNEANSGLEDCTQYALKVKLASSKTSKDPIRRPRQNSRGRVLYSSNFSYKDLMQTDYQPPHRKSPIHNK